MATVISVFGKIPKTLRPKVNTIVIDNIFFKLHYRCTMLILLVASILVTSQEFFGAHIQCICDSSAVPTHVMNTFCFFTSTFTLEKHYNSTLLRAHGIAHPGVGPMLQGVDEEIHHTYYQWVPFILFLQALMFYAPHFLWKHKENGRMKSFVAGLECSAYSVIDKDVSVGSTKIPSKSTREKQIRDIKRIFVERLHINSTWTIWLIVSEIMNALNLLLQVYFTNLFLSGKFYNLGPLAVKTGVLEGEHILDIVFPKVTKCTFYKYGPSGTLQAHDAMCIMSLNIINEKIFVFLWFWYVILGTFTLLGLLYRVVTIIFHSRSLCLNKLVFSKYGCLKLNPWDKLKLTKEFHYTDWLFLYYLSKNMDPLVFTKLLMALASEMEERSPLILFEDEKNNAKID